MTDSNDSQSSPLVVGDEQIDIYELASVVWRGKWIVVAFTSLIFALCVVSALSLPDIYRAEALLTPSERVQPTNPLIGQLANIGGISLSSEASSRVDEAIATLQSRQFIINFIERHNIAPWLFASRKGEEEGEYIIDPELFDEASRTWVVAPPPLLTQYSGFRSMLGIEKNQVNGMVTLSMEWTDRNRIKEWVDLLVKDVNEQFRKHDRDEAVNTIDYLRKQLESTQLVELRQAFNQLIESQTRIVMLADARVEYILKTIDPAFVPETKVRPQRSTIVIVGTFLGLIASIILVFVVDSLRRRLVQGRIVGG